MTRFLLGALALACVSLLGACNASDISALQASGAQPTLQEGALSPAAIASSGLPPATQAKLNKGLAKIAQVRAAAARICGYVPIAESVANVFIASSATSQTVQGIANLTCRALQSAPTYAALGDRHGERVKGRILIEGWTVEVIGERR